MEIQRRRMERLGGALKQRERGQTTFDDVPNMDSDDADGAEAEQERRLQPEDLNKLLAHAPSLPGAKDASDNKPNIGAWQGDTVKAVANTPQRAQRSDALAG
jgi:N-acyl-D-aspartate/D-glutamate deacylase